MKQAFSQSNSAPATSVIQLSITEILRLGLRQFALNPDHWHVFQFSDSTYAAAHLTEDLVVIGEICYASLSWKNLELITED